MIKYKYKLNFYNLLHKMIKQNIYIFQYLNERNAAAPALIQTSSSSLEGSSKGITKLVECPVVDNVPA